MIGSSDPACIGRAILATAGIGSDLSAKIDEELFILCERPRYGLELINTLSELADCAVRSCLRDVVGARGRDLDLLDPYLSLSETYRPNLGEQPLAVSP